MDTIEIYFWDLTQEKQEEIMQRLGDNGNYDMIPIAEIPVYDDEEEEY